MLRWWLVFVSLGIAGGLAGYWYMLRSADEYMATATIKISTYYPNGISSPVKPIEEPFLLVARLDSSGTYDADALTQCGASRESLARLRKVAAAPFVPAPIPVSAQPVAAPDLVTVSTRGSSPDEAARCADGVFQMVQRQQAKMLIPVVARDEERAAGMQKQWTGLQSEMASAAQGGQMQPIVYLRLANEISDIQNRLRELNDAIRENRVSEARLVVPVNVSSTPLPRSRNRPVLSGLMLGLMLAAAFGVLSEYFRRRRLE